MGSSKDKSVELNFFADVLNHSILVECKSTPVSTANDISYVYTKDKTFNTSNGVVCFWVANKLYASPKYNGIVEILLKNGFRQDYMMHVPFSNGKVPPVHKMCWNELLMQMSHAI